MLCTLSAAMTVAGCDHSPNKTSAPSATATSTAPAPEAPAKPQGPPQFAIDSVGPKVGWERVMVKGPGGAEELLKKVAAQKQFVSNKDVKLVVDRNAKSSWVVAMLRALSAAGAIGVTIHTPTRKELPSSVEFTPESRVHSPALCSVVSMVLEDRSTAVWKLAGGTAVRRARGFAGPDLAMTGESLERAGKACRDSDLLFVSAEPKVEWGLIYDLAAEGKTLKKARFRRVVLLNKTPIAGRKVDLSE